MPALYRKGNSAWVANSLLSSQKLGLSLDEMACRYHTVTPVSSMSLMAKIPCHGTATYNENLKLTGDAQLIVFRSLR
jgi:hypothetical protein